MGKMFGGSSLRTAMQKVMSSDYRKSGRPGASSKYTGMKPGVPAGSGPQAAPRSPDRGRRTGGATTPLGG